MDLREKIATVRRGTRNQMVLDVCEAAEKWVMGIRYQHPIEAGETAEQRRKRLAYERTKRSREKRRAAKVADTVRDQEVINPFEEG